MSFVLRSKTKEVKQKKENKRRKLKEKSQGFVWSFCLRFCQCFVVKTCEDPALTKLLPYPFFKSQILTKLKQVNNKSETNFKVCFRFVQLHNYGSSLGSKVSKDKITRFL